DIVGHLSRTFGQDNPPPLGGVLSRVLSGRNQRKELAAIRLSFVEARRVIESLLPIPTLPRVARMSSMRPFVTVVLGRAESGVPLRPLVIQLEGEERAVLELVNVEDLAVTVSALGDANHGGNSTPGRFFLSALRRPRNGTRKWSGRMMALPLASRLVLIGPLLDMGHSADHFHRLPDTAVGTDPICTVRVPWFLPIRQPHHDGALTNTTRQRQRKLFRKRHGKSACDLPRGRYRTSTVFHSRKTTRQTLQASVSAPSKRRWESGRARDAP